MLESIRKTLLVEEKYVEIFDGVLAELMKVVDMLKQEDFINDESQLLSSIKSIFEQVVWEEEKKLEKDLRKQICQKAVHIVSHGIEEWVCDPRQVQVKAVIFLQRVKLRVKEELEKNPELRYFVINEMMKEEEGIDKKKEKEEGIDEKKEAKKDGRLVHHQYLALRQAAVTMQSYYRGNQTRKMMLLKQESARRIQSWYKGRKQHILYIELRKSVLICQKTYRACRLAQSHRKKFLVLKGAALTIQAYYKGYKTRCIYQRMKQAIVLLQSGSRGFLERRRLKKLHKAATIIQRMIRNHRHIKLVKQQEKARQTYLLQFTRNVEIHLKATVMQRCYRKHASLCEAKKQLHSALIIQNWVKGRLCRIRFLKLKRSVHVIETAALQWIRISHDKEKKQPATKIQSMFEKVVWEEEKKLEKDIRKQICQKAVHIVSHGIKEWVCDPRQVQVKAVIFLQRLKIRFKEEMRKNPDIRYFVFNEMMKEEGIDKKKEQYMKIKQSVCIIQRRFRAYLVMKKTQKKYLTLKEAVITIQACLRGYCMRHEYKRERAAIVKLQSCTRKVLCQRNYARLKQTVIKVQRRYRQKVCVAKVKEEYMTIKGAANTIQAHYRSYLQKRDYKQRSVVVLQSAARGWKARRQVKQRKLAIIHIQAVARKLIAIQRFQSLKKYTELCQQHYQAKLHGRLVHHQYLALRQAAVTMQSCYRGNQTRKMMLLKQESARRIQSWYKGRKQCILYTELRKSVLTCQKTYRACRLAQSDRKKFLVLKRAALTIQAYYKGYKTRCIYQRMKQAIVLLQSGSRGFLERRRLKKLHEAATIIQQVLRKFVKQQEKARQTYLLQFTRKVEIHLKATAIQRCYRKHASLCEAKKQLHSALIIQNWVKGRLCHIRFLKLKRSVHVIETAALQWIHISHDKEKKQAANKIQEEDIEEEKEKPKKLGKMKRFRKWLKRTFCCSG